VRYMSPVHGAKRPADCANLILDAYGAGLGLGGVKGRAFIGRDRLHIAFHI